MSDLPVLFKHTDRDNDVVSILDDSADVPGRVIVEVNGEQAYASLDALREALGVPNVAEALVRVVEAPAMSREEALKIARTNAGLRSTTDDILKAARFLLGE